MKQKAITITLIILTGVALLSAPLVAVHGQSMFGLTIFQIVPRDGFNAITTGNVSQPITVQASLYTSDGPYLVYFGDVLVDNSTASGYYVASNFSIPELPGGFYKITLVDVTIGYNTTSDFGVTPQFLVQPLAPAFPAQLQEGAGVVLNVSVIAGAPNTPYTANITIKQPAPLNDTYNQLVKFTTSELGTATAQITYPDSSFTPLGSTTIYAGTYTAYFNESENLGVFPFNIGITDKIQYHRGETVTINAVGYQPGQTATVTIMDSNSVLSIQTVTASSQGIIHTTWAISEAAALGTYNVTITPQGTAKAVTDFQTFSLPGHPVLLRAFNLAGSLVPELLIQVHDPHVNQRYNATDNYDGTASISLEAGSYTAFAYWNGIQVGERQFSMTSNSTFDISCQLTNLHVAVKAMQDNQEVNVPYVNLDITIRYGEDVTQTKTIQGQTDFLGIYEIYSVPLDAQYTIAASKYDVVFNADNNTVSNLPEQAAYQVNILCPTRVLTLKTVDSNLAALPNTRIELVEQTSGVFYSTITDSIGTTQLQVIFGQYRTKVYTSDNTLLNETIINVLGDTESQIRCARYNLKVTVKVVDYFGNPLYNANVQLSRSGRVIGTATTQNDGIATFENIVGGDLVVTAHLPGNDNAYVSKNIQTDSTTAIQLSMTNFVSLGGFVISISVLATITIIAIVLMLFAVIIIYRKTRYTYPPNNKAT